MGVFEFFTGLLSGSGDIKSTIEVQNNKLEKAFSKIETELHITLPDTFKRDPKVLALMSNPKVISVFTSGGDFKDLLKIQEVKDVLNDYPEITNAIGFNFKSLIPYLAGAGIALLGTLAFQRDDIQKQAMPTMMPLGPQPTILDQWRFTNQTRF